MSTSTPVAPPAAPVSYALSHDDSIAFFAALTLTLIFARICGEIALRLKQPAVLGELIAGIILGKTVLNNIWPAAFAYLYGPSRSSLGFSAVTTFCSTMFMLVAGLEMNLNQILLKRRPTLLVGLLSFIFPLFAGFVGVIANPEAFAKPAASGLYSYALFCGTAMSITALPVAAKTLRDLHLYRTEMGSIVMGSATTNDLMGWCLFAVVLSISQTSDSTNNPGLVGGIVLSVVYEVFMLTIGLWLINKILPFSYAYLSFPGGIYGLVGILTLASASFALYIGLHNTLGGFLMGTIIGNSPHAKPALRNDIDIFVSHVLAPLFFGSICINVNFVSSFDIAVVALVLFIACAGKLVGGFIGARLGRCTLRECFAIAVCMNARGAMELILANVALSSGVINQTMFVALVLTAILTSLIPGPLLRRILMFKDTTPLSSFIAQNGFVRVLRGTDAVGVIGELCVAAGASAATNLVVEREQRAPTGYPDRVAIPHALLSDIQAPIIVVGVSPDGIDFKSRDESLSRVIILLLCPASQAQLEQEILTRLTALFSRPLFFEEVLKTQSRIELLALMAVETYAITNETNFVLAGPAARGAATDEEAVAMPTRRLYLGTAEQLSTPFSEAMQNPVQPLQRKTSSSLSSTDKQVPEATLVKLQ